MVKVKTIFEKSASGKVGVSLPESDCPNVVMKDCINQSLLKQNSLKLPELSEPEVVRHFVNLSSKNHHIDKGFYPLGSCTMKYNPKINDMIAGFDDIKNIHPLQNPETAQGCLEIMYNLEKILCDITGMHSVTLQPSAGSQGEFAGLLAIKRFHESKGDNHRDICLIPVSYTHLTLPTSALV